MRIEWERRGPNTSFVGTTDVGMYLIIPLQKTWAVDYRKSTSDRWHFPGDTVQLNSLEEAKQWCEMYEATGANG